MAPPTTELGSVVPSWGAFAGSQQVYDWAEETPELTWPASIRVYDRMRRQDAQVRAIVLALTLPLRRPIWSVDPAGADPAIAAQVAEDVDLPLLGEERKPKPRMARRFSFDDHLRLALMSLFYGHMPFEQTYEIVDGRVRLHKLAPRFPATILAINVERDGGLRSIEQEAPVGVRTPAGRVEIPVDRLVFYVVDREGGAWQGNSVLRSAYKHWLLKDRLMRVQAQTIERNGMGIPVGETGPGWTQAQEDQLFAAGEAYRAGSHATLIVPHGGKMSFKGVEGALPDALPAISYHDTQIARSVLAQFLQLGTSEGSSGNRALGGVFVDFFTASLDALASQIADTFTQHVVEDLVDLNWGTDTPAPRVVANAVDAERDMPVESLTELLRIGAITMDDDLEDYLRSSGRLPPRNVEQPPHTLPSATTTNVGQPVAAARRRPPDPDYHDRLANFYRPRVAQALAESVDPDAIVAAAVRDREERERIAAAKAEQEAQDRRRWDELLLSNQQVMARLADREPVAPNVVVHPPPPANVNVTTPDVHVSTPPVNVAPPSVTVEAPAPKARRVERDAQGNIARIVEE